jgi:E3 ubiquitin-protein ligase HERC2
VDQSNARDGSKVVRGPDWRWGDQDGGAGKVGRLQGTVKSNGWVDVKWPSGDSNTYRAGADGKYDLALAVDVSLSAFGLR